MFVPGIRESPLPSYIIIHKEYFNKVSATNKLKGFVNRILYV